MLWRGVISHLAGAVLSSPQKSSRFSSSSTLSRLRNSFDDNARAGSAVYQHALKFRRPAIIEWRKQLDNTVNLIGSVTRDPRVIYGKNRGFGVHTSLRVKSSCGSSFQVLLMMWAGMAEIASKHLKQNDLIFASGHLESYEKDDGRGNIRLFYKVIVKELNFVAKRPCYQGHEVLESTKGKKSHAQDYENRLHLWQVFFTNPHEWWDNRKHKSNPNSPDFKHKNTGEALWLSKDDPPWVKRQLQKLDSEMAKLVGPCSRVTNWVYQD
ncbi:protein OSB1, mitochondrial-like [Neltuma alba]|uniref:protein OSB1, mitochondrial-like n=1 Tax=Neltuma alba TaxID=207710 RepID=UPI0010A521EB|nr:protein OSB1, mitochondrial-like [Prosopis alba]